MADDGDGVDKRPTVEDEQRRQESLKLLYDWFKHLTTLSTGSILISAALVQGVFPDPTSIWMFVASIVFFVLSLGAAMITMMGVVADFRKPFTGPGTAKVSEVRRIFDWAYLTAWGCFLIGIGLFVAFAARNAIG